MECVQPVSAVKHQYSVQHWTKNGMERKTLDITVFPDDTVARVLMKISHALGKTSLPYAWKSNKPMLFRPNGTWVNKGYHVNPWKAKVAAEIDTSDAKMSFEFQQLIPRGTLNITFKDDVNEELQNAYYFPDFGIKLSSKATLAREDDVLIKLWQHDENLTPMQQCVFTHVEYHGVISKDSLVMADIFDVIKASKRIPFVQWVDDRSRVLYKVSENHNIPSSTIQLWTQHDRLPITNGAVIFYSPFMNNFCRCFIDSLGNVQFTYHLDARDKLDLPVISNHNASLVQYISSIFNVKINVTMTNISMKTNIMKSGTTMQSLASVVGTLLPVFHIVKLAANSLDLIYKRASNYNTIDVTETIKTLLQYGSMSPAEIAERLIQTYGFSMTEASTYIEQATTMQDVATNKKIETGIAVNISPAPLGFKVSVDQAPSLEEASCALHWVRSCVAAASVSKSKEKTRVLQMKKQPKAPSPPPPASPSRSRSESEKSLEDPLDLDGGGIGNEYKGYFLNMLQKADPRIFVDSVDYARKCMVTNFRQPVVISKQDKEDLEKKGYAKGIDNFIEYGSDANQQNIYFCPRIWCPESKIPLTPEQYEENGRKCPSGEKAIDLYDHDYWDHDPSVPHMIGFHTSKSENGFCLPCCMKRIPDQVKFAKKLKECRAPATNQEVTTGTTTAPQVEQGADDEQYYLMTQNAPLPKGRYGTVPKPLHNAIFPNIAHAQCSKVLTSQECLVRKGIDHENDSLLAAVASALGMASKQKFVKWVKTHLDPLRFLTLENGNVLMMFASSNALVPKDHGLMVKKWKSWIANYPDYISLLQIQPLLSKEEYTVDELYIISRELAIFDAYTHFVNYLQSPEPKNPYLLYDLLKHMGVMLLLWERQDNDNAYLYCPLYTSAKQIVDGLSASKNTIMLLKDGDVYEPLELKQRNKHGMETIPFTKAQKMVDMLYACNQSDDNTSRVVANLIAYDMWIDEALTLPSSFRITTLVLGADMKIAFGLTKENIVIKMPYGGIPLGFLHRIMESLKIKQLVYHDDIEGKTYAPKFMAADLDLISKRLAVIGFGFDVGRVVTSTMYNGIPVYATMVQIPPSLVYPSIRTAASSWHGYKDKDRKWHQIRMAVGRAVLGHYDTLVKELATSSRKERTNILMNTFPSIPDKKILQAVIDELPLTYGAEAVANWLRRASYPTRFPFLDPRVIKQNKQYIFSQVAVEQGLPRDVLEPPKGPRPAYTMEPTKQQEQPLPATIDSLLYTTLKLPDSIKVELVSLPSKWTQIKNYQWSSFKMGVIKPYSNQSIWDIIIWVSSNLLVPITRESIEWLRYKKIGVSLKNIDLMSVFLEDPSTLHHWNAVLGKKYNDGKQLLQKTFAPQIERGDVSSLIGYWRQIADNNKIWFNDLDIYSFVNSVPCSVVVLHRSPYGSGTKKRGNIEDLAISSTFFTHKYSKSYVERTPLIILYKTLHNEYAEYSPIVDENGTFLYKSLHLCPKDVQDLVKHHVQNKTNRMS